MKSMDGRFCRNFGKILARRNGLFEKGFVRWAFHSGMLFNSREKWWGDRRLRRGPHEGLDIGFYLDLARRVVSIPSRAVVPAMSDGEVLAFGQDDFYGVTLYIRHPETRDGTRVLCSLYGHVTPHPELHPGRAVRSGEVIATVSDFGKPKSGVSPHLHLSVAWMDESIAGETLTWKTVNESGKIHLLDPMEFFTDSPLDVIPIS